jgi:MYXO-CTERM domain-containing protein
MDRRYRHSRETVNRAAWLWRYDVPMPSTALRSFALASLLVPASTLPFAVAPAEAQVTLAQDTLSSDSPAAALCGFCGGEGFGVVFRELAPPARGLLAEDFPLTLRSVEIALASARLDGAMCQTDLDGGTVLVDVEIWAGTTPPGATIGASAPAEPWPGTGEELVFAATEVPIELSIPDGTATGGFMLQLNRFEVQDEMGAPLRIAAGFTYLRVFVQLSDSTLPGPGCPFSSDGSPLRDDGRISDQRSYILANGMGFLWNEQARVNGDWAIRLQIIPSIPPGIDGGPPPDAAFVPADAGPVDAGEVDAGTSAPDAGTAVGGGGGCSCRVGRTRSSGGALLALAIAAGLVRRRRR